MRGFPVGAPEVVAMTYRVKWVAVVKFDRRYGNVPLRWLAEHMRVTGFNWKVLRR